MGAFKQPKLVLCDTGALKSLPHDFLVDGMGEVVKYGMIKSDELFGILMNHDINTVHEVMDDIIARCVAIKEMLLRRTSLTRARECS